MLHLEPPKSSSTSPPGTPMYQPLLALQQKLSDAGGFPAAGKPHLYGDPTPTPANKQPSSSSAQAIAPTSRAPAQSLIEDRIKPRSPLSHQDVRCKSLLKAADGIPRWWHFDKEGRDPLNTDPPKLSAFPRLQEQTLAQRISWLGTSQRHTNICPLDPAAFSMPQQQTSAPRGMKHPKENPTRFPSKKNSIQLRHASKSTDLNLPLLPPSHQSRLGKKMEILRLNFA